MSRRAILASMLAAAVVIVIFTVEGYVSLWLIQGSRPVDGSLSQTLMYFSLFGWPLACVVILLVSSLLLPFLRTRAQGRAPAVVLSGGIIGALALPAVWGAFWGTWNGIVEMSAFGAIAGVTSGACFWLVIRPELR
jgi:hypothetical protein